MTPPARGSRRLLPISMYQRRYWLKWSQAPQSSAFNTSIVFLISGALDKAALRRACQYVIERHEILHATFSQDGSEQYYSGFAVDDFFTERADIGAGAIEHELPSILNRPFDLESGPLCRFYLLDCGGDGQTHYFIANAHHILADAVSAKVLVSDLMTAYAASLGQVALLSPAPASAVPSAPAYSYADCIAALHAAMTAEQEAAARAFWKAFLADTPLTVAFPRLAAPVPSDLSSESLYFQLDARTTEGLKRFAKDSTSTLFIVLFALYGFLLAKYAGQRTVVISYPVNMRPQGHAHVFGCFVNLLVKKVVVGPDTTLRSLVGELTQQQRDAKPHMSFQLGSLVHDRGDVRADIERSFFSVFFGETHLNTRPLVLGGLRIAAPSMPWSQEFDRELRLLYDPSDAEAIKLRMDYRTSLFDRALILGFIAEFEQLAGRLIGELIGEDRPLWPR
jgi:Condensation domain